MEDTIASDESAVRLISRSKIKPLTEATLAARTGGRCQFRGCNEYLYRSALTGEDGNFSDKAHIVAFREDGPRGEGDRPENIDDIENLMLLCLRDHRVVDRNPTRYTREELRDHKREHEARIAYVTGLGRFCCRTWLRGLTNRDSVGVRQPSTERFDDGAAQG